MICSNSSPPRDLQVNTVFSCNYKQFEYQRHGVASILVYIKKVYYTLEFAYFDHNVYFLFKEFVRTGINIHKLYGIVYSCALVASLFDY